MFTRPVSKWFALALISFAGVLSWRAWVSADDPGPPPSACHLAKPCGSSCSGSQGGAGMVAVAAPVPAPAAGAFDGWRFPVLDAKCPHEIVVRKPSQTESEQAIEEELDNPTILNFPGSTIGQVVEYLRESQQISIRLDEKELSAQGITNETEVNVVAKEVKLSSALALLLGEVQGVQLAYVIRNESLLITSLEKADAMLETRIYDVRCLGMQDPQKLTDLLMGATNSRWRDRDGGEQDGIIRVWAESLVIRQTQAAHREIEKLLKSMAAHVHGE